MITPSEAEIFRRALDRRASELWTAIPARVETYYASSETADVLPVVRQPLGGYDDEAIEHEALPVLPAVPVVFPAGGGCSIRWRLERGDHVLVIFATLSPAAWRRSGEVSDAGTTRRHALGYGFALAGVGPRVEGLAEPTGLELDGPDVLIGGAEATHPIARGDGVAAWLDAIVAWVKLGASPPAGNPVPPPGFPTTSDVAAPKGKIP